MHLKPFQATLCCPLNTYPQLCLYFLKMSPSLPSLSSFALLWKELWLIALPSLPSLGLGCIGGSSFQSPHSNLSPNIPRFCSTWRFIFSATPQTTSLFTKLFITWNFPPPTQPFAICLPSSRPLTLSTKLWAAFQAPNPVALSQVWFPLFCLHPSSLHPSFLLGSFLLGSRTLRCHGARSNLWQGSFRGSTYTFAS